MDILYLKYAKPEINIAICLRDNKREMKNGSMNWKICQLKENLKYREKKVENSRKTHKELMGLKKLYISCVVEVPV